MKFLHYPKCSTSKKGKKFLDENNISYEIRDIALDKPSFDELKNWHKLSGLPLKRFFNTSGLVYRSLGLKDKLADMSEEDQLKLLASDGMLVKRPILVANKKVLVGFKQAEWEELLK